MAFCYWISCLLTYKLNAKIITDLINKYTLGITSLENAKKKNRYIYIYFTSAQKIVLKVLRATARLHFQPKINSLR